MKDTFKARSLKIPALLLLCALPQFLSACGPDLEAENYELGAKHDELVTCTGSCCASSCEGIDPDGTDCQKDAVSYGTTDVVSLGTGESYGTITLRYSRACKANWARIVANKGPVDGLRVWVEWKGELFSSHGLKGLTYTSPGAHTEWSYMTDGTHTVRASGSIDRNLSTPLEGSSLGWTSWY